MKIKLLVYFYYLQCFANCNITFINNSHNRISLLIKINNLITKTANVSAINSQSINLIGNNIFCNLQDDAGIGEIFISLIGDKSIGSWTYNANKKIYVSHGVESKNNGSVGLVYGKKMVLLFNSAKVETNKVNFVIADMNRNQSRILSSLF